MSNPRTTKTIDRSNQQKILNNALTTYKFGFEDHSNSIQLQDDGRTINILKPNYQNIAQMLYPISPEISGSDDIILKFKRNT